MRTLSSANSVGIKKIRYLQTLFFLLLFTLNAYAQEEKLAGRSGTKQFQANIRALQKGELSSMSLHFMDSIKVKQLMYEKIDERDAGRHKSGFISAKQLQPITRTSICEITDRYILLIVEDEFKQLRALTVRLNGEPIESMLIVGNLLYLSRDWYEYEARRYSPSRPYHYNSYTHEFTFSTLFKLMEPHYEEVLIDLKDHMDETTNRWTLKVNEEGGFAHVTYEPINSNTIEYPAFTLKSGFFQNNTGKVLKDQTYRHKDHMFRIYLDRSQTLDFLNTALIAQDQVMRVMPKTKGKIEVFQRHINTLSINGDGDYCELDAVLFTSDWEKVEMKNDLFSLQKYAESEQKKISALSLQELKQKIKKECGDYHLSLTKHIERAEDIPTLAYIREVIIKIDFTDAESAVTTTEYLILVMANGC